MSSDITHNVRNFKQDKRHKQQGLTDEEVERLVQWWRLCSGDMRDLAILSLLIYQGLRQFEICNLDWDNINLKQGVAWIRGKGRDDIEPIYLHPATKKALHYHWEDTFVSTGEEKLSGAVFKSKSIKSPNERLTTRGLRYIIKSAFEEIGIEGKKVHGIRHYFVTRLLKEYNGNISEVALYTRHKSWETVQIYNNRILTEEDLPRFFNAFKDIKLVDA